MTPHDPSRNGTPQRPEQSTAETANAPAPEEIRAALERILASQGFCRAPRLQALLRYVVERTLAGQADRIKGLAIAMDVLGRGPDFDPARDSVVRVEMGRLRQALAAYYAGPGRDDPVRIIIPKGTYVPRFVPHDPATEAVMDDAQEAVERRPAQPSETMRNRPLRNVTGRIDRWLRPMVILLLVIVITGPLAWLGWHAWRDHRLKAVALEAAVLPEGPALAVLPVLAVPAGTDSRKEAESLHLLAEGFTIQLTTRLAAFRRLVVLAPDTAFRIAESPTLPEDLHRRYPALYVLRGTMAGHVESLHMDMLLASAPDRHVVWSHAYDRPRSPATVLAELDRLALKIAATLGQPEGVIERHVTASPLARLKALRSFLCVARFYRYLRHKNAQAHAQVRACLEKTVKREACYADAWAALSWIYADEHRLGFNQRPEAPPPFRRAYAAAQKGVECAPENATAWLYLGQAAFTLFRDEETRKALLRALSLNPGNANLLATAGTTLALMGHWNEGLALMRKAFHLNPYAPRWYHGILFLAAWRNSDATTALAEARAYHRPGLLLTEGILVAALARARRTKEAETRLAAMQENYGRNALAAFREQLRLWRIPADLATDLLETLEELKAGGSG